MSIFVALSTFGGVNGAMLTTSRIFFVAGEEKQMPRIMAFLHIHKLTPLPAVVFTVSGLSLYRTVQELFGVAVSRLSPIFTGQNGFHWRCR